MCIPSFHSLQSNFVANLLKKLVLYSKNYNGDGLKKQKVANQKPHLTDSPRFSPLSVDTLSATAIADILRGCVQIMLQKAPRPDSISDSITN
jgi:hypothetical protein